MKVEIFKQIKTTAGGFHSWVLSNVGIIRKPNNKIIIGKEEISWWKRFWLWLKMVIHRLGIDRGYGKKVKL